MVAAVHQVVYTLLDGNRETCQMLESSRESFGCEESEEDVLTEALRKYVSLVNHNVPEIADLKR